MAQNDNGSVALSWQQPSSLMMAITEDFESYRPNTVDGGETPSSTEKNLWGEWSVIDKDAAWTESYFSTKMPFDGYKYAFVLYNPELWNAAMLEALPALQPHSGSQYMMSTHNMVSWLTAPAQNNWLVSPELDGQAQEISFWVRSYSEENAETYTVRYSTSGIEADSFTEVEGAAGSVLGEWTEVKVQLPEGTKRFAICQTTASNANIFMFDDVTYYANAGEIASYNIYVDGELVANVGADNLQYEVEGLAEGEHEFAVTVVYADGQQSQPVVATVMVATGIVTVSQQAAQAEMFNLKGQAVGGGYHDIVVSGGKKIVR